MQGTDFGGHFLQRVGEDHRVGLGTRRAAVGRRIQRNQLIAATGQALAQSAELRGPAFPAVQCQHRGATVTPTQSRQPEAEGHRHGALRVRAAAAADGPGREAPGHFGSQVRKQVAQQAAERTNQFGIHWGHRYWFRYKTNRSLPYLVALCNHLV